MERPLVVALIVLALTAAGAAAPYQTILYTDDLSEDFGISGEVWSQQLESGDIGVTVTYDLTLTNDAYNRTRLTAFRVGIRNSTAVLASTTEDTFSIDHGQTKGGYVDLTIPTAAEDGREVFFQVNHSAVVASGERVIRRVHGDVSYSYESQNGTIRTIATNASTVERGDRIFINGTAELVRQFTVQGQTLDVSGSDFSGWIPVPTDLALGPQEVTYTFETATGHRIIRSFNLTVQNQPPQLSVDPPSEVEQNATFTVPYTVSDDTPPVTVTLSGINGTVGNDSIEAYANKLDRGLRRFNVTATDQDGASTTVRTNVTIVVPGADGDPQDGEGTGEGEGEQDDEQDSQPTSIPIIGAIREFFVGLIQALLGLNSGGGG